MILVNRRRELPRVNGIFIRGEGVAASCCAYLLAQAGFSVSGHHGARRKVPAVMLSDAALALIRDVFECGELFRDAPRISRRVVAWGPNATPRAFDHAARVVSEDMLLSGIGRNLREEAAAAVDPSWTVFASRPLPEDAAELRFGARVAFAGPVRLNADADPEACWIESLESGWLFLIPGGTGSGSLISVGATAESQLPQSRLVAPQIAETVGPVSEFPAYPRIITPLCGPGWLACGSAAMGFDPICGDGTAQAVREAILASAVIRAAAKEPSPDALCAHYEARLTAGFHRHLELCREYYQSGGAGAWWQAELEALQRGMTWCEDKRRSATAFRYRLEGFELARVS